MKCPKCGFNSFDYLESCKKCGNDLKEFKGRFSLRSLLFPHRDKAAPPGAAAPVMAKAGESDFDYGFMEQDETAAKPAGAVVAGAAVAGAAAVAAAVEDSFDIDWQQDNEAAPPLEPSPASAGGESFALDTQGELAELLFDESADGGGAGDIAAPPAEEAWDEDALADLSVGEELPAFDSLEEELPDLAEVSAAESVEVELPTFDELDFAGIDLDGPSPPAAVDEAEAPAWGDIDFEGQEKPISKGKSEAAKETPADPFDQPEPAAAGQAPEPFAATAEKPVEIPPPGEASAGAPFLLPSLVARLGAFWLDLFLVVGAFLLFLIIGTRLLAPPGVSALLPSLHELITLSLPYYLLFFLVCFAYFTAFHLFLGQTPGKMLFGLRLEGSAGRELAPAEAFLHSVGGLACLLSLGAGFFLALRDAEGRGWNDRMAGTRLVAVPEDEQP
ncbi:RDD family protein [Geoalkalibacter sp.]|uniref:RDD family protein n=1 Tax=Geoalkalibacter sp. TaxID=3041440 RepID=UPI00272EDB2E|nr:RDD family protein [Geoalkalibacter sp.]